MLRVICVLALLMVACGERGSGEVVTEERDVSGFDRIVLDGSGDVVVTFGDAESLVIEAEDNLMRFLTSEVEGDELVLDVSESIRPTEPVVYRVTVVELGGVETDGSGDIEARGVRTPAFEVESHGSGDIVLADLEVGTLIVSVDGSGDVEVSGSVDELDVEIDGSGDFDGGGLEAEDATIEVSGSGHVVIEVEEDLVVEIGGSGDVEYMGDPDVDLRVTGSGEVVRR